MPVLAGAEELGAEVADRVAHLRLPQARRHQTAFGDRREQRLRLVLGRGQLPGAFGFGGRGHRVTVGRGARERLGFPDGRPGTGHPGVGRWNSVIATDIALNYELPIHNFALFAKAEVRNALNHHANITGNRTVYTSLNNGTQLDANNPLNPSMIVTLKPFNPFTSSPIRCTLPTSLVANCASAQNANYLLGPAFGQSTGTATTFSQNGQYQLPRTYLYAIGARF